MRFALIEELRSRHPVRRLCGLFDVSPSGYYAWCSRPESRRAREDRRLCIEVRAAFKSSRETYGARRVHLDLREQGVVCGRHRVRRLMKSEGLQPKKARQFRVTTQSGHGRPVASNVLDQQFDVARPGQVWAGDITYIRTLEGWLYLAVLLDLCSRRVVGWALRSRLDDRLTLEALRRAVAECTPPQGLLHHSDRGSQYSSDRYRQLLETHGVQLSMSRRGNCYDNSPVESFFDTLKTEEVADRVYRNREEARIRIVDYLERFYNRKRRHSSLGDRSPIDFERQFDLAAPGTPVSVGLQGTNRSATTKRDSDRLN